VWRSRLTATAAFFSDFPEICLGAAVDLSSGFSGLAVSLVAVTMGFSGAPEQLRRWIRMWVGGWSRETLDDTHPRKTRFHISPSSICSAEGPAV